MIELDAERIASEAGVEIVTRGDEGHPARGSVDSRELRAGDLFFGLPGEHADGGRFAGAALAAGAWGVVVAPEHATGLEGGWVLTAPAPLVALQRLARAWRRELRCKAVGITGSTGKTSVKDICDALLPGRVHASPENLNTEVGLPLAVLEAPPGTDVMVLEMAMRGRGQIAELASIAEPDVGAVTNVGPVHLELLGTLEAVIETKAELVAALPANGAAVLPVDAPVLAEAVPSGVRTIRFGPGGEVKAISSRVDAESVEAVIRVEAEETRFEFPFTEAYNLTNALAAIAIGTAIGVAPAELAKRAGGIRFSRLRGELVELGDGIVVVNDCYNANPISMHAALDHLASLDRDGRLVAVLGDMNELGPDAESFHREAGAWARAVGVEVLVGVGELAAAYEPDEHASDAAAAAAAVERLLEPGDSVLVKGSRAVGLEAVTERLRAARPLAGGDRR